MIRRWSSSTTVSSSRSPIEFLEHHGARRRAEHAPRAAESPRSAESPLAQFPRAPAASTASAAATATRRISAPSMTSTMHQSAMPRHGEPRQRFERHVVVELLVEDAPGLGEEAHLTLLQQRLAIQDRVVHRRGRTAREVGRDRQVVLAVGPPRFGRHERDRSERTAPRHERHDHRAAQAEVAQLLQQRGAVAERLLQPRLVDRRPHLRLLCPDHQRHPARRVGVDRQPLDQSLRALDLLGILVRDRQPLDRSVLGNDVDDAPVRKLGHDQRRNVRERRLVVE